MKRILRHGVLALAGSVACVAVVAAPAPARQPPPPHTRGSRRPPPSTVEIGDQAPLSADGRTASVLLTVTCLDTTAPPINVSLRQNGVGGSLSDAAYKCTGHPQHVVVPVTAGSGAFHLGPANVSVSVTFHTSTQTSHGSATTTSSSNTSTFSATRTIQLT
ncbi:MAG: hypothetical protein JOZ04_14795 [Acidimicrobiia bacterium]|nr:hypothetical protein [Acidimicrobiia bacterium]